jgi:hypothetical protein
MGPGYLEGLMTSSDLGCRIAIYWVEPEALRGSKHYFCNSDFIFSEKRVWYWLQGMTEYKSFPWELISNTPLIPRQASLESIVQAALATVDLVSLSSNSSSLPKLEVGRFLHQGRGQVEYTYESAGSQPEDENNQIGFAEDSQILNQLPFGRRYAKQMHADGSVRWEMQKAQTGQPLLQMIVKPLVSDLDDRVFDPNTLGDWTLIDEPYRLYWECREAYARLPDANKGHIASRALYDRMDVYLKSEQLSPRITRALNRLRFKVALATGDAGCITDSVQADITGLCQNRAVSDYHCLLELARCDGDIRKVSRSLAGEVLPGLLCQMVDRTSPDTAKHLDRLLPSLHRNKWLSYGSHLLAEIEIRDLASPETVADLKSRIEAMQVLRGNHAPLHSNLDMTVRRYLAESDQVPQQGSIDLHVLSQILVEALNEHSLPEGFATKQQFAERVVWLVRGFVGDGLFRGDRARLESAVAKFTKDYHMVNNTRENLDVTLATVLALSFCDISSSLEHDRLKNQFNSLLLSFESQAKQLLSERNLDGLVKPEDVAAISQTFREQLSHYVDGPLWPMFKFPLSGSEETSLHGKLTSYCTELVETLDDVAVKTQYGGASERFRQRVIRRLFYTAESLLVDLAFQRIPHVKGVRCRFVGNRGFSIVIDSGVFGANQASDREVFRKLRYFHIGRVFKSETSSAQ